MYHTWSGQKMTLKTALVSSYMLCFGLVSAQECGCTVNFPSAVCDSLSSGTTIPTCVPSNITNLVISSSPISVLNSGTLQRFANLQQLDLVNCGLDEISGNAFVYNKDITGLSVENNTMALLLPTTLQYLPSLQVLNLRSNLLDELSPLQFSYNGALVSLDLGFNSIHSIQQYALSHAPNIQKIDLGNNAITTIDSQAFGKLDQLTELVLSNNQLTTLNGATLSQASALSTLSLDGNPWHCDCGLAGLVAQIREQAINGAEEALCSTPADLAGKDIVSAVTGLGC